MLHDWSKLKIVAEFYACLLLARHYCDQMARVALKDSLVKNSVGFSLSWTLSYFFYYITFEFPAKFTKQLPVVGCIVNKTNEK